MNALLASRLGYLAIFVGTLLEGEAFLLLGGFLAHRGELELIPVIAVSALGAATGDLIYFLVGRYTGRRLAARHRWAKDAVPFLERLMTRFHVLWIFAVRYLWGLRWLGAAIAGWSGFRILPYVLLALPACLLWATIVGVAGYGASELAARVLGRTRRYEPVVLVVVAVAGLMYAATAAVLKLAARSGKGRPGTSPIL